MAEPVKVNFEYQNPDNVEAEVPGAQKLREVQTEAENTEDTHDKSAYTEVRSESIDDGVVLRRHHQVISNSNGKPGVVKDVPVESKRSKTKIPVSKFRQTVERVRVEQRHLKKPVESHIPVRRKSMPKNVKENKAKVSKVVNEIETKKEAITADDEFDKIYEEIVVNTPTEVNFNDKILNPKVEDPEVLESKFEEIIHDYEENKVQSMDVEKIRKSKIPFMRRRSEQDADFTASQERKNKIIAARDKLRSRRSVSKAEGNDKEIDQEDQSANSSEQNNNHVQTYKEESKIMVNNKTVSNEITSNTEISSTRHSATNAFKSIAVDNSTMTSNNYESSSIELLRHISGESNSVIQNDTDVFNQEFKKTADSKDLVESKMLNVDRIVENNSTTIAGNELEGVSIAFMKQSSTTETMVTENKQYTQHTLSEDKILKDSIKIGIPVFSSHGEDDTQINKSEVDDSNTSAFYNEKDIYESPATDLNQNSSELDEANVESQKLNAFSKSQEQKLHTQVRDNKKSEIRQDKMNDDGAKHVGSIKKKEIDFIKLKSTDQSTNLINDNNTLERTQDLKKFEFKGKIDKVKVTKEEEDEVQIRSNPRKSSSRIESKELLEIEANKRESINELAKKKSVMSKIAMFERKEADVAPSRRKMHRREIMLPKIQTKILPSQEHIHLHTPLIVDEITKSLQDIKIESSVAETSIPEEFSFNNVKSERVVIEGPHTVIFGNKIEPGESRIKDEINSSESLERDTSKEQHIQEEEMSLDVNELPSFAPSNENKTVTEELQLNESGTNEKIRDSTDFQTNLVKQKNSILLNYKPVKELLRTYESQKEFGHSRDNKTLIQFEKKISVTDIQTPLAVAKEIRHTQTSEAGTETNKTELRETLKASHVGINSDTDEVFIKQKNKVNVISINDKYEKSLDDVRRAKSAAELDLGDAVKGKVNRMVIRMTSLDRIELDRKEKPINKKEMPRKLSVSEKIALFEGKLTMAQSESQTRVYKPILSSTETSRRDLKNTDVNPTHVDFVNNEVKEIKTDIKKPTPTQDQKQFQDFNLKDAVTSNGQSTTESSIAVKDEEIRKKIEELNNGKLKYGRMENKTGVELSNGMIMPALAVGTALIDRSMAFHVVSAAIDLGYRAIDTAYIYGNEKEVGEAINAKIADGTVQREDLFVISKLWSTYHRSDLVETACRASLETMGLDYFDLYMIHNPMSFKEGGAVIPKIATVIQYSEHDYLDAWFGMERLLSKGLVKALGVSNFNSVQLQRVLDKGKVKPVVNQVECHPYLSQERLQQFCNERNVTLNCYGVLGSKGTPKELRGETPSELDDPLVVVMASGLNVTPAQLLLRYQLDSGRTAVVKASSAAHLWENLQVLTIALTPGQVAALHALNKNKRNITYRGMGDTHKNYPFNIPF